MKREPADFGSLFDRLRSILQPYAAKMVAAEDDNTEYSLETTHRLTNKKPMFFAAVRRGRAYVNFHLMPVYVTPDLLARISPELKRRMQGKSCFNFKSVDEGLFQELAQLTRAGFDAYHKAGYV